MFKKKDILLEKWFTRPRTSFNNNNTIYFLLLWLCYSEWSFGHNKISLEILFNQRIHGVNFKSSIIIIIIIIIMIFFIFSFLVVLPKLIFGHIKISLNFFFIKEFMVLISKESITALSAKLTISTIITTENFEKNLKTGVGHFCGHYNILEWQKTVRVSVWSIWRGMPCMYILKFSQ